MSSPRDSQMDTLGTRLRLRVCLCVFITFVDYAYKNYTSPRSQRRAPATTTGCNLSHGRLQRSCFFYGLFRFCLTLLRITRNPTQSTTEMRKTRLDAQLDSTETRLPAPGNSK
ncbi:uncharacterized protein LOC108025203 isoform X1 [Drosophila biarmipes]|uniref:uncharacterized protein LOC108025203 isoform X1 n=1 Tax=Drosophila biarmipes TaxID=125945 RepID=UPI0007E698B3|nr:uncharacterized protein LOC108025203 isoform X1 [Drosophila biarmipes]